MSCYGAVLGCQHTEHNHEQTNEHDAHDVRRRDEGGSSQDMTVVAAFVVRGRAGH